MTNDSTNDATPDPDRRSGKGAPTPSRAQAEAQRKKAMKQPMTRREQAKRDRDRRMKERVKQREALYGDGSINDLPARDRGPERAVARAVVDRRRTIAEFMLPVLVIILVLSFLPAAGAYAVVMTAWFTIVIALVIDSIILSRQVKKALRERGLSGKGHVFYAIMRSTQLRRFRLPKPTIKVGDPIPDRF